MAKPLPKHQRRSAKDVLSVNLRNLMQEEFGDENTAAAGRKAGIPQKTVHNAVHGDVSPRLVTIEKLAHGFGLETYQLLLDIDSASSNLLSIIRAYNRAGPSKRRLIEIAAKAEEGDHNG